MNVLGAHFAFNQLNHDPGAALIRNGELVAVCEEERFNRIKSARGCLPYRSIVATLTEGSLGIRDIDLIITTGLSKQKQLEKHIRRFF